MNYTESKLKNWCYRELIDECEMKKSKNQFKEKNQCSFPRSSSLLIDGYSKSLETSSNRFERECGRLCVASLIFIVNYGELMHIHIRKDHDSTLIFPLSLAPFIVAKYIRNSIPIFSWCTGTWLLSKLFILSTMCRCRLLSPLSRTLEDVKACHVLFDGFSTS